MLTLVLLVTAVMADRGLVSVRTGDVGTLARPVAVGSILLVLGVGLYRRWDAVGRRRPRLSLPTSV